jgi:hypothetical protein
MWAAMEVEKQSDLLSEGGNHRLTGSVSAPRTAVIVVGSRVSTRVTSVPLCPRGWPGDSSVQEESKAGATYGPAGSSARCSGGGTRAQSRR